LTSAFQRWAY